MELEASLVTWILVYLQKSLVSDCPTEAKLVSRGSGKLGSICIQELDAPVTCQADWSL